MTLSDNFVSLMALPSAAILAGWLPKNYSVTMFPAKLEIPAELRNPSPEFGPVVALATFLMDLGHDETRLQVCESERSLTFDGRTYRLKDAVTEPFANVMTAVRRAASTGHERYEVQVGTAAWMMHSWFEPVQ